MRTVVALHIYKAVDGYVGPRQVQHLITIIINTLIISFIAKYLPRHKDMPSSESAICRFGNVVTIRGGKSVLDRTLTHLDPRKLN